jgi:hypothetical protein
VERPLPVDLDEPLAAFDPHAILAAPREPVRAVSPLVTAPPLRIRREPLAPGERISSVEIPPPHASETDAPSIESLLARLERGTERRALELRRAG